MANPSCLEGSRARGQSKGWPAVRVAPCADLSHGDPCVPSHTLQPGVRVSGAGSGVGGTGACACQSPVTRSRTRLIPCRAAHAASRAAGTEPGSAQEGQGD